MKAFLFVLVLVFGIAALIAFPPFQIVLAIVAAFAFYFLPTIIANGNHKRNAGAILALNLLLGWTLIGWVVALVWSLTSDAAQPVVVK